MLVLAVSLALTLGWTGQASGAGRGGPEAFREGSFRVSLLFGSGTAFRETYRILGAGAGYYLRDNIEAGLEVESWKGDGPALTRLSPQATYIIPLGRDARPYAGVFYRRTLVEGRDGLNDAGGRGGILFLFGRQAYLGVGMVHERHLACDRTVFESCSETYPELMAAIIF